MANKVEKTLISETKSSDLGPLYNNKEKEMTKMTSSASSPPVIPSWAPMLFPPWNSGLLPAAFYPAALRSLPK